MRRLITLGFFLVLLSYLIRTAVTQGFLRLPLNPPALNQVIKPQTSPQEVVTKINTYRLSHELPELSLDSNLCQPENISSNQSTSQFLANCPTCTQVSLITVSKFISPNELLTAFINDDAINQTLLSANANYLCPIETNDSLLLFFATRQAKAVSRTVTPQAVTPILKPTASPKNFTDLELWQALSQYRQDHKRSTLTMDQNLCNYAHKRLNDQISLLAQNKPASAYPVPDKYPLDGHAGFSADADSGLAFDMTQKNHLAENLAFWPDAQTPVQVIEWGWDSSTEGHKETQLSNDWTVGCVSTKDGFYDAIFGY